MKKYFLFMTIAAMAVLLGGCDRVKENESNFDNVIYIENAKSRDMETIMIKAKDISASRTVNAGLALPAKEEIHVNFRADLSMVSHFSQAKYMECEPLPAEFFELSQTEAVIAVDNVLSSDVRIDFKGLEELPRNVNYVLPVTITNATGMDILESSRTMYYVIRKGATINTVANMANNYFQIPGFNTDEGSPAVQGLTQVTFEALLYAKQWKSISSIMGIEEYFLIRFGDTFNDDEVQLAVGGNLRGPAYPVGKWVHFAMTYDRSSRQVTWYIDGVASGTGTSGFSPASVTFNKNNRVGSTNTNLFYIGYSFDPGRYFDGYMSEVRIWNTVRTEQQIAENMYEVDPESDGLVAYWKLDDGVGNTAKDYSKYGNHASAMNDVVWISVELPQEN